MTFDRITLEAGFDNDGRLRTVSVHMPPGATEDEVAATIRMLARNPFEEFRPYTSPAMQPFTVSNSDPAATHVLHRNERAVDSLDANSNVRSEWGH